MAGRGRGRGRGQPAAAPVRPGGGAARDPMEQLANLVKGISLDADDKEILPVTETATKAGAGTSAERLAEVTKAIYGRCLDDWRFAPAAAKICVELVNADLQAGETTFRTVLLQIIQNDHKNRQTVRQESPQKLLGSTAFLCQVYAQMRDGAGGTLEPLTNAVVEGIEMVLDDKASDEEMICAAEQLYTVGKTLQTCMNRIRLTSLRNKVKDKIIHAVGSREVRCELIKVVEGFASEWKQYT